MTRCSPASRSATARPGSAVPLVVSARSSTPSIAASIPTRSGRSRRSSGSPPVSRSLETPRPVNTRPSTRELLEGEQLVALEEGVVRTEDLARHAVPAAEVAAVGHRHPQVGQGPARDGRSATTSWAHGTDAGARPSADRTRQERLGPYSGVALPCPRSHPPFRRDPQRPHLRRVGVHGCHPHLTPHHPARPSPRRVAVARRGPGAARPVPPGRVRGHGRRRDRVARHRPAVAPDVAIKLLLPHRAADDVAVARFRVEALATVRATHPNAVRVYDALPATGTTPSS